MDILILERTDFDNFENHNPFRTTIVGTFAGGETGLSAHGKAADWFAKQPPVQVYLGWDGEVYPRCRLTGHPSL